MRYQIFSTIFLLLGHHVVVVMAQMIRGGNKTVVETTQPFLESSSPTIYCLTSNFIELIPGKKVKIAKAPIGMLCTLTKVNGDESVPIARSYDNYEWEASAGPYSNRKYVCDYHSCEIDIPDGSKEGDTIHLQGFQHSLPKLDEAARFFEQATFGLTQTDLLKVRNATNSYKSDLLPYFARWIYEQSYEEMPSSHRAFWRQRTKPTYESYNREGRMTRPCEQGSLWRGYAFTPYDENKSVSVKPMNGRYALEVNGEFRTMVDSFALTRYFGDVDLSQNFKICRVDEVGIGMRVSYDGQCYNVEGGNPIVSLQGMSPQPEMINVIEFGDLKRGGRVQDESIEMALSKQIAQSNNCNLEDKQFFTRIQNGNFVQDLIFEPQLVLQRNMLEDPLEDGGKTTTIISSEVQCANAPRTFLNEEYCQLSKKIACVGQDFASNGSLQLSPATLKAFFTDANMIVYAIVGLRLDERYQKSPCVHGVRSRWKQVGAMCQENVHPDTALILSELIKHSDDKNQLVKDIFLPPLKQCHPMDSQYIYMEVKVGEECWKTVHPDLFNVYDFSGWAQDHPGNRIGFNPIKNFAIQGAARLVYPESHLMSRWHSMRDDFTYLGRLGDEVTFDFLPDSFKTKEIAEIVGLLTSKQDDEYTVVCGSPYETENIRNLSPSFAIQRRNRFNPLLRRVYEQQRRTVWTTITVSAADQLRQRVAWALSQIFSISADAIAFPYQTESFVTYYDIFVRHAMGNYRDILKEVAFSPMMAQMLSYLESKSSDYIWNHEGQMQFADENFSREVMQLFSIGLVELNSDGTTKLDPDGNSIATYSNDDITEYARLWTGFRLQPQRGNTEERATMNNIDPMAVQIQWRDQNPKLGLNSKYIGDHYALCNEMPLNSFLRKGAKYRLLGNTTQSEIQNISSDREIPRLEKSSHLYDRLCQPQSNGNCTYSGVIYLRENLQCSGSECELSSDPQIVQLHPGVYYEFIRTPCVHFPFKAQDSKNIIIDSSGKIAIIDDDKRHPDTLTFFRVEWQDGFPHADNSCGNSTCKLWMDKCICQVAVENDKVFSSMPTYDEVLDTLKIGAAPPHLFKYQYAKPCRNGFALFYSDDMFGIDSAFRLKDKFGRSLFLKNMKSNVIIMEWDKNILSSFQFRNTPSFYGPSPEVKDALYETDAGIDQYFFHESTAPFVATRFIQRFGISNPSPRFVESIVNAFRSGRYEVPDREDLPSFGSGRYGDLSAMVAAILLDRESRNVLLEADKSYGSIREPVIKVTSVLRSMNYIPSDGNYISLYNLDVITGQMAHDSPSVFSFFLPEYAPSGSIAKSSLVAPEGMLLPNSVGLSNGLVSLVNFGLTSCFGGFGSDVKQCKCNKSTKIFNVDSDGKLAYVVPRASSSQGEEYADIVVNNLATMLTSGRLSNYNRDIVKQAYLSASDDTKGLRLAQQLILLSPEFNQIGLVKQVGRRRSFVPPASKTCKKYKAIVHILLKGGCDSFNLLVPHSQCKGKDLYDEYKSVRGPVALKHEELLPINAESSNQTCAWFGVNPHIPLLKELYDTKEALFLAGIGILSEPVNKFNYEMKTKTRLFAHNELQAEISRLDPFKKSMSTGVLGRLIDVMISEGNVVNAFSVDSTLIPLEGGRNQNGITKAAVNSRIGFQKFNPSADKHDDTITELFEWINGEQDIQSNIFGDTWAASSHNAVSLSNRLYQAENSVKLKNQFPDSKLGQKLSLVSKMIGSKDCRGSNRDVFFIETGKFDHHEKLTSGLKIELEMLNQGLETFIDEMKSLNAWDDLVILVSSDFGRTLTPNSKLGSDHGWSGNSFMLGGSINGGKILGQYPNSLKDNSPLNVGRGRLIPTMPFEAPWNAIAQWLGISKEDDIDHILPNRKSFPSDTLLTQNKVFIGKEKVDSFCQGEGNVIFCIPDDQTTSIE